MEAMRVNRALVVYDDVFATYAMDTFRHQTERLNLTLAFVPLEANRTRVLEAINHTLRRMSRKNTFYTSFVMLVFANFTLAERLEAELVTHIGLNPNMRLLLFYNGWDKSLGRWYYQHEITCTFEKQIYVITRAHIGDTRNIMMTASANWGSHDHVFTMPDISTLVFIHYVILYTSHHARNLPQSTACGTPMDDVLEGMKQNITTEVKRLSVHRSTARYRTFFLAPVTSKEYRLKLIENWRLNNASLERTVILDEVDAYLRNRTINVAILEQQIGELRRQNQILARKIQELEAKQVGSSEPVQEAEAEDGDDGSSVTSRHTSVSRQDADTVVGPASITGSIGRIESLEHKTEQLEASVAALPTQIMSAVRESFQDMFTAALTQALPEIVAPVSNSVLKAMQPWVITQIKNTTQSDSPQVKRKPASRQAAEEGFSGPALGPD
ncbi:hypothetical protein MRX96_038935 [Rhipicephalus microplus]